MSGASYSLEQFDLYQDARTFRRRVYHLIRQLPREERFSLDPQMRRAAVSITNIIAEGHGRWHYLENIQFCRISRGSIEEVIDEINTCLDEGYGDRELSLGLKNEAYELVRKLNGYIANLQRSRQGSISKQSEIVKEPLTTHYSPVSNEDFDE